MMNPVAEGYIECYSEFVAATDNVGQARQAKKRACEVLQSLVVWLMGADESSGKRNAKADATLIG